MNIYYITLHNAPHPSSRKLFRASIRVSNPPFGTEVERKVARCLAPSHPIRLFVRSKDFTLLEPLKILTTASILSSVKPLFANDSLSANFILSNSVSRRSRKETGCALVLFPFIQISLKSFSEILFADLSSFKLLFVFTYRDKSNF
jgi:hypothetical protein